MTAVRSTEPAPIMRVSRIWHPWSVEEAHQDVADRKLLNRRVRIYGDDIAAVVAEDEVAAAKAARLIRVEYEEYEPVITVEQAMAEGAPAIHEEKPDNVLAHSSFKVGSGEFSKAAEEPGLCVLDTYYDTQTVQDRKSTRLNSSHRL